MSNQVKMVIDLVEYFHFYSEHDGYKLKSLYHMFTYNSSAI